MMKKTYKVLWFDDEHQTLELIKEESLENDVEFIGFSNAKEGLEELNNNYLHYDAIVLDGLFFKTSEDTDALKNTAFGEVAKKIQDFKSKGIIIPWFILSGQKKFVKDESNIVEILSDKDFANGKIFDKSEDVDFKDLLNEIKKEADKLPNTKLRHRYSNIFDVCSDEYLGTNLERDLLNIISNIENDLRETKDLFISLRKTIEIIFTNLKERGLIPYELTSLNQISLFISGKHDKYNWRKQIVSPTLTKVLYDFLQIVQDTSHETPENSKLKVSEYLSQMKTPYLYKSMIFNLLDIITWYKYFIDENNDIEENKKLWYEIKSNHDVDSDEWVEGEVIKIADNGWGTFKSNFITEMIGIPPNAVETNNLNENDIIYIKTKPSPDGKKTFIKEIKMS